MDLLIFAPVCAIIGLIFAGLSFMRMKKEGTGSELMQKIAASIHLGAMVYLKRQYTAIAVFVVILAIVLTLLISPLTAGCFIVGALLSATAGFIGMNAATMANVRTTHAARNGMAEAFRVSFSSGMVMGLTVVGLGLLGLSATLFTVSTFTTLGTYEVINVVSGFSLGASSIALFARVGGGIFTKAADVGADLVGKVEAGIPEDDPRNPAVIADNVGDNVGDIAGMGADLYESYVGAMIATMLVGASATMVAQFAGVSTINLVLLPLLISAAGIIASIIGSFFVRTNKNESGAIHKAFNAGTFTSLILTVIATYLLVTTLLGPQFIGVFVATIAGLVAGFLIGLVTEYYTRTTRPRPSPSSRPARPAQRPTSSPVCQRVWRAPLFLSSLSQQLSSLPQTRQACMVSPSPVWECSQHWELHSLLTRTDRSQTMPEVSQRCPTSLRRSARSPIHWTRSEIPLPPSVRDLQSAVLHLPHSVSLQPIHRQ